MSRHYEFVSDSAEVVTREQAVELFEDTDRWHDDTVALVLGDPYDAAAVLTGTRVEILQHLTHLQLLVIKGA